MQAPASTTHRPVLSEGPPPPGEKRTGTHRGLGPARSGSLLAVCGLCGGAGASTLAYLIALAAARWQPRPVLVGDTGGPGGGLAEYTGVAAPNSLGELAERLASGQPPGPLFTTTEAGLRVLATSPRLSAGCARAGVELLLDHARGAYGLTIIDCGTLAREADQVALSVATHVAWVMPATRSGARRARRVLEAVDLDIAGVEFLVARRDQREPKTALQELKQLATSRRAPLILLPHLPDLSAGKPSVALDAAQVPLQAIHGLLQR
jgi:cellulose biosynthesis protein BcsQ